MVEFWIVSLEGVSPAVEVNGDDIRKSGAMGMPFRGNRVEWADEKIQKKRCRGEGMAGFA